MDTSEISSSRSSSITRKPISESISERIWEYVINMYQAYDNDKYRKMIRDTVIKLLRNYGHNIVEPEEFDIKHHKLAPYYLFFSRIDLSEKTYNQRYSITFPEILDRSLGEIVNSLQLTFIVDVTWLCSQYVLAGQRINMTIVYGVRIDEAELSDNVTAIQVGEPTNYECHHTKIMILQYNDGGIRVIVSTANLFSTDWKDNTNGLWISPHLPPLPKHADFYEGESPTNFKRDLGRYLSKYKNPILQQWIELVKKTDFFDVNVFLVTSVPGRYTHCNASLWGHKKLSRILSHHATLPADAPKWPLVVQSSSIGTLGPNYESWLSKEIVSSMSRENQGLKRQPKLQFIYPSLQNYRRSYKYDASSACVSYSMGVHSEQKWIESYLYQWSAKRTGRDLALPHIKSYTRISPDLKSIPWFVLTSANLSKAAWGVQRKNKFCTSNYEAGIAFLPKFVTGTTTFPIEDEVDPAIPVFPIMHDLPLRPYNDYDTPLITRQFANWSWLNSEDTTVERPTFGR